MKKRSRKKIWAVAAALALVVAALPFVGIGGDATDVYGSYGIIDDTEVTFRSETTPACEHDGDPCVKCGYHDDCSSWTPLTNGATISDGHYIVPVGGVTGNITIGSGEVWLCLNGQTIDAGGSGSVITVSGGATLHLCDCGDTGTITGGNADNGGGVYVNGDTQAAFFDMYGGTIIGNSTNDDGSGGGVYVFTHQNSPNVSVFNMYGGTISENTADDGGGGVRIAGGKFNMHGGLIGDAEHTADEAGNRGNNAGYFGGGVCIWVEENSSDELSFNMYGGTIAGNTAAIDGGGVGVSRGEFTISDGEISGNKAEYGGGVRSTGEITMLGGKISNNTATESGGGVRFSGTSDLFTLSDGEISCNKAPFGGGVYIGHYIYEDNDFNECYGSCTFNMVGGKITGNETTAYTYQDWDYNGFESEWYLNGTVEGGGSGGGVCLEGGTLNMSGGEISNNKTYTDAGSGSDNELGSGANGGGVYCSEYIEDREVKQTGTFNMSGTAVISGNEAFNGGGVFVSGGTIEETNGSHSFTPSAFTMTDGTITGNRSTIENCNYIDFGGGGVCCLGPFTMSGGKITYNTAAENGGGVSVGMHMGQTGIASFEMSDGEISYNTASGSGGGVAMNSPFTMSGGKITYNRSLSYDDYSGGGGVQAYDTVIMSDGEISHNEANGNGGGMYFYSIDDFTMTAGKISENASQRCGGGVYLGGATHLYGGEITGNCAGVLGGGVHSDSGGAYDPSCMSGDITITGNWLFDEEDGERVEREKNDLTVSTGGAFTLDGALSKPQTPIYVTCCEYMGTGIADGLIINDVYKERWTHSCGSQDEFYACYNYDLGCDRVEDVLFSGWKKYMNNEERSDYFVVANWDKPVEEQDYRLSFVYDDYAWGTNGIYFEGKRTITFNAGNDTNGDPIEGAAISPTSVKRFVGETIETPPSASRAGYVAGEWTYSETFWEWDDDLCMDVEVTRQVPWTFGEEGVGDAVSGNLDLYAAWVASAYNVTFEPNGGAEAAYGQGFRSTDTKALRANEFTRDGYTFIGWNTAPDGSGDSYDDGEVVTLTADLTLYAVWEAEAPSSVLVKFFIDGTEVTELGTTVELGGTVTEPEEPTRDGYLFYGWYTKENCDESYKWDFDNGTVNDEYLTNGEFRLYGKWVKAYTVYYIRLEAYGDDREDTTSIIGEGECASEPRGGHALPPEGCGELVGWYTNPDRTGEPWDFDTPIDGTVTENGELYLYAKWASIDDDKDEEKQDPPTPPSSGGGGGGGGVPSAPLKDTDGDGIPDILDDDDDNDGLLDFEDPDPLTPNVVDLGSDICDRFDDLEHGAWYEEYIQYVVENGLMEGISDTLFDPNGTTSRAQIVMMLWRMEGEPLVTHPLYFADVSEGAWYADALRWTNSEDIVLGYDDGRFGTNDPVTREQIATILWRYARFKGIDTSSGESTSLLKFSDAKKISAYAISALQWACGEELIRGTVIDDGSIVLDPQGSATRAQVAAILMRFCEGVL